MANEEPKPKEDGNCWPTYGAREIDLFEYASYLGSSAISNFVKGETCGGAHGQPKKHEKNAFEWHTYRVEFKDGKLRFSIDGEFIRELDSDPWQDQNYHAILNVAMGSFGGEVSWPN